jgi:predicted protein tyrosine phosphatase
MKILCVCAGGRVRSQALALEARFLGHEALALAASSVPHSDETFALLSEWADKIVTAETEHADRIPEQHWHKIAHADLGVDRWGNFQHPELREFAKQALKRVLKQE